MIFVGSYWQTRVYYLHFLGLLYFNAFLVAYFQNEALIGDEGLTPATLFIDRARPHFPSSWDAFIQHPTLFWFRSPVSQNLNQMALLGCIVSLFPLLLGAANFVILFTLWILYFSIVNVGQTWYSFGWESQLLEVGFMSMFMVPCLSLDKYPSHTPTPWIAVWGNRWLLFRIMIGAGMIKVRGDECWRDLTCMNYHYQTQPNPNPFSIYFHHNPDWIHRAETMGNHIVELICPWLLLVPQRNIQMIAGSIQILFQVVLILSGNLAFLNWLTILPAIMCFDDTFFSSFSTLRENQLVFFKQAQYDCIKPNLLPMGEKKGSLWTTISISVRRVCSLVYLYVLVQGSYPVIMNLLSPSQGMNISFGAFRLVNSYGAFGSVTKVRHEVVLQGTREVALTPETRWKEFQFFCKPSDINKTPCWISPYHLRIDWLLWFAAFQSYQQCPWLVHFGQKLVEGRLNVNILLHEQGNPFYNESTVQYIRQHPTLYPIEKSRNSTMSYITAIGDWLDGKNIRQNTTDQEAIEKVVKKFFAPKYVRAVLYEYQYASLYGKGSTEAGWEVGKWYKRKPVREYMPPISSDAPSVQQFLQHYNLIV